MRAGRLEEILIGNETIVVCGHNNDNSTNWIVMDFARKFPYTEVIKLYVKNNKLNAIVYDATAKALLEKRYEDVIKYAATLEVHTFTSDIEYINRIQARHEDIERKIDG